MTMKTALLLTGFLVGSAYAQTQPRSIPHVATGGVFDSVGGRALAGAIVQAVQLDSTLHVTAHVYWAVTDARGHFKIDGIPSGRFAFGFQHDALNALRLESPMRVVELAAEENVTVDLAIRSGAAVRMQSCAADQTEPNGGMLAGFVRAAETGAGLDSATVEIHWMEVALDGGNYRLVPHRVMATMSSDGNYVACGVVSTAPVSITVTRKGYRDVSGEISVPHGGAARRDFHLAGGRADRGTAALAGHVVHADSTPVNGGHAIISALGVDVPVANGAFTMSGLPSGTWAVEARAIGFEPRSTLVDLVGQTTATATIVISDKVQKLEAMSVIGNPNADYKKLVKILERKRVGFGTFFMPGDERLTSSESLRDLVGMWASGFRITKNHTLEARIKGGMNLLRCEPTVFVDGVRGGPMPPMTELLAVVAYPDLLGTPVQWRDGRTCAAIAVWTKH